MTTMADGSLLDLEGSDKPLALARNNSAALFNAIGRRDNGAPVFRDRASDGRWRTICWQEIAGAVEACAHALLSRGVRRGEAIAILASTRPEWIYADMAAMSVGAISVGIYPTEPAAKVRYIVEDSAARVLFVDTADQVTKARELMTSCPTLRTVVVMDTTALPDDPSFVSLDALLAEGRELAARGALSLQDLSEEIEGEDTAMLIYTSGTTGPPKGAMIPHRAFCHQAVNVPSAIRMRAGWDRPAYLPLCHVAERIFTYCGMTAGMINAFVPQIGDLPAALLELRPQFFIGVPRIYEKLRAAAQAWIHAQTPEERAAMQRAQERALDAGGPQTLAADDCRLLDAIRAAIGLDRTEVLISGGAQCSDESGRWQRAIGAPVHDLYGMTECGLIAVNFDDFGEVGVVGRPCPYGEVRLSEESEILVRGAHVFKGYNNLPARTADAIRDGWYHTGDIGRLDDKGRLILIDRIKDILITSGGKNVAPSLIEGALRSSPYIAHAVAIGENRHFISALIFIEPEAVAKVLLEAGEAVSDFASLATSQVTRRLIKDAVQAANRSFSRAESIRDFRIVSREITDADDLFTPTMKVKRAAAGRLFADLIEAIYSRDPVARGRAA